MGFHVDENQSGAENGFAPGFADKGVKNIGGFEKEVGTVGNRGILDAVGGVEGQDGVGWVVGKREGFVAAVGVDIDNSGIGPLGG